MRRPRRTRFFVGCEGESEQGYAALLQKFSDSQGLNVHIDARVISNAGDPLAIVSKAIEIMRRQEQDPKSAYAGRFILLDRDILGQNPSRDRQIEPLAQEADLTLVWQKDCFEAFLLRHFPGNENVQPATSERALRQLNEVWRDYRKGCPASKLAKHIQLDAAKQAAQNPLNADYLDLFKALGLIR